MSGGRIGGEMLFRTLNIAWKELLQLRRDRRMLPMVIVAPILQLMIYGYAISTTVSNINLAIYDGSRTPESRALIRSLSSSGYFNVSRYADSLEGIDASIDRGEAEVAVVIPPDFSRNIVRGITAPVQVIVDGSDPSTATTAVGYLAAVFRRFSSGILVQRFGRVPSPGVDARIRVWYNLALESRNYMVPGIIAMIMMQVTMNLTALAIVREREKGTIEQLIVSPIRRSELIAGKALPYAAIGYADVFLILLVGTQVFGVPIQGSVLLLLLLSGVFLLNSLGMGLFISAVSRNQQQAIMAIAFIMFPNFLLSGFFYPVENMPGFIQVVTYVIPLRYYLVIVRSIFLKGTGIALLWTEVLPMTVLGALILFGAVMSFKKRLD